ncbi:oxidoreductase [Pseudothermotoga sp. U03pept]|uniref:iron-sulfur cluster-binding protein n=1 Tax=Pseudothermotoga sp. U03pept TaxID=3447012 RepID=UPI003F05D53C
MTRKNLLKIDTDNYLITFNEKIDFEPTQFIMIETQSTVRKPFALGRWQEDLAIGIQVIGEGTAYIVQQRELKAHGPLGKGFVAPSSNGAMIATVACLPMAVSVNKRYSCDVFIASSRKIDFEVPFETIIGDEDFVETLKKMKGYDWYLIVGSDQMERIAYKLLHEKGQVYLSLNEYMACGIGACRGCAVKTKEGVKHLCTDGPVLRGDLL